MSEKIEKLIDELKPFVDRGESVPYTYFVNKYNVGKSTITRKVQRIKKEKGIDSSPNSSPQQKNGKEGFSKNEFCEHFDENSKIRSAIRKGVLTLTDDDEILEDARFRQNRCDNPPVSGWRRIAEEQEFTKYQFRAGNKIWWTTPKTKEWALINVSKARDL